MPVLYLANWLWERTTMAVSPCALGSSVLLIALIDHYLMASKLEC